MATLRDQIIAYFETKDKIMPTVNQMYNTSTELSDISVQHTAVELELIKQQITIWLNREEYNITRNKIELAVNYYFANSLICSINDAAAMYGADPDIVKDEVIIACSQLWTKYHFDRPVETPSGTSLTYKQQYKLNSELHYEFVTTAYCHCRICYLLKLSIFAHEFVKKYNYPYPLSWDTNGVDFQWLQEHEMIFQQEIFRMYKKDCMLYEEFKYSYDN